MLISNHAEPSHWHSAQFDNTLNFPPHFESIESLEQSSLYPHTVFDVFAETCMRVAKVKITEELDGQSFLILSSIIWSFSNEILIGFW